MGHYDSRVADRVVQMYLDNLGSYRISDALSIRGTKISPDTVRRILRRRGVKLRPPNNTNKVPSQLRQQATKIAERQSTKEALEYLRERGNTVRVDTIQTWLREKHKTFRPLSPKIEKAIKRAARIYHRDKIGVYKIANRLQRQGIDLKPRIPLRYIKRYTTVRTNKESLHLAAKHKTKPFGGNRNEMFYLMGFRAGDLHVQAVSDYSILVSSNSSLRSFGRVFEKLFRDYGHVASSPHARTTRDGYFVCERSYSVRLERPSFGFLLTIHAIDAKAPDEEFFSYLSGFGDAEMCINISRSGRKKAKYVSIVVDFSNKQSQLLENIKQGLLNRKIHANIREAKTPLGEPYWRVYVKRKKDVLMLLRKLRLTNEDKLQMRQLALRVLRNRMRWAEAKPLVESLRQRLEQRRQQFQKDILEVLSSRIPQRNARLKLV